MAEGVGILRMCADDIALMIRKISSVPGIAEEFGKLERFLGLKLNHKKRVAVALHPDRVSPIHDAIKEKLASCSSEWGAIKVARSAKYLGFHLGPDARGRQWADAIQKFEQRIQALSRRELPVSLLPRLFTAHAISVLSYLGSVSRLPSTVAMSETRVVTRLLRLPGKSLIKWGWIERALGVAKIYLGVRPCRVWQTSSCG